MIKHKHFKVTHTSEGNELPDNRKTPFKILKVEPVSYIECECGYKGYTIDEEFCPNHMEDVKEEVKEKKDSEISTKKSKSEDNVSLD